MKLLYPLAKPLLFKRRTANYDLLKTNWMRWEPTRHSCPARRL